MMTSMRRAGLLWALCVLSGPWQPTALAQSTDPEPAGFTQTQAAAGKIAYDRHCASCHGAGLQGAGITPGLAGDRFDVHWRGVPAGRLMSQLRRMPPENPGGLSAETYAGDATVVSEDVGRYAWGTLTVSRTGIIAYCGVTSGCWLTGPSMACLSDSIS